jgi:hypothetical protein
VVVAANASAAAAAVVVVVVASKRSGELFTASGLSWRADDLVATPKLPRLQ